MDKKEIERKVREILADRLDTTIDKVLPSSRLIDDLGMDSMKAIEVMFELKDILLIDVADNDFMKVKTVADVVKLIEFYIGEHNNDQC